MINTRSSKGMFQPRIAMPFTFALECSLDPITQSGERLSHVEGQPCLLHESSVCYVYDGFTWSLEWRSAVFKTSIIWSMYCLNYFVVMSLSEEENVVTLAFKLACV